MPLTIVVKLSILDVCDRPGYAYGSNCKVVTIKSPGSPKVSLDHVLVIGVILQSSEKHKTYYKEPPRKEQLL